VFVYQFDHRDPRKQQIADRLIREGLVRRTAIISFQVVQELYNAMYRRFPSVMTLQDSQQYLATVLHRLLAVPSSVGLYSEALRIRDGYQLSWYDSLIVAAALEAKCETLYTEDLQNGQRFGDLVIRNPFEEKLAMQL